MSVLFDTGSRAETVDVDGILAKYKRGKSKTWMLILACLFLFIGCFGGFTTLWIEKSKVEHASGIAIELAEVAANSEFCTKNIKDPTCIKAEQVVKDPTSVIAGAGNTVIPMQIMKMSSEDYFKNDPLPAVLGLATAPLVILRLQLKQ